MANDLQCAIVKYNTNGGSGGIFPTIISGVAAISVNVTGKLSSSRPSRDGYNFLGWATSSSATSASYQPGQTVTLKKGTTLSLYAVWEKIYRTVSFNANGGTGTAPSSIRHWVKSKVTIPTCNLTKPQQDLAGWARSASATSPEYSAGSSYTFSSNVTLYAVWGPKRTVPVLDGSKIIFLTEPKVINTPAADSSFRHTLKLLFKDQTITIATNVQSSYTYTAPASLAYQITDANQCAAVIECTTYDGSGKEIGKETCPAIIDLGYLTAQTGFIPKISLTSVYSPQWDTAFHDQFGSILIQKKTQVVIRYSVDASQSYGATVAKLELTFDGKVYECGTTSGTITLDAPDTFGTKQFKFKLTDSRGNEYNTGNFTYPVYEYYTPTVTFSVDPQRDSTGTTVSCKYKWDFAPVNNSNVKQITIRYKEESGSSWTTLNIIPTSYSGEETLTFDATFNPEKYYIFEIYGTDFYGVGSTSSMTLNTQGDIAIDGSYTDGTLAFHHESPSDGYDHWYKNELHFDDKKIKVLGFDMVKDKGDSVTLFINGAALPNSSKKFTVLVPLTVPLHGTIAVTGGKVSIYKQAGTAVFSNFTFLDSSKESQATSTSLLVESITQYVNGLKIVCRNVGTAPSVSTNELCSIIGELKLSLS